MVPPASDQPIHHNSSGSDSLLDDLCDKTHTIVAHLLGDGADQLRDALEPLLPPADLVRVLRSPIGPPQVICVRVRRRMAWVRVTPSGRNDPKAERRTWMCICDNVLAERHAA
jgi:hypothetical protein